YDPEAFDPDAYDPEDFDDLDDLSPDAFSPEVLGAELSAAAARGAEPVPMEVEAGHTEAVVLQPQGLGGYDDGMSDAAMSGSTVVVHVDDIAGPDYDDDDLGPARTGATMVVDVRELLAQAKDSPIAESLAASWGARVPEPREAPAAMGSTFDLQELLARFDAAGTEVELVLPEAPPPVTPQAAPASAQPSPAKEPSSTPQLPDKLQEALAKLRRREPTGVTAAAEPPPNETEEQASKRRRRARRRREPMPELASDDAPELVALYRAALADLDVDEVTS
ncbi:MAG: hypothetical protein KDK70_28195, partial [Myxococcales bacterium]|nr:hypothetical protein [Myxococcales bacterium]